MRMGRSVADPLASSPPAPQPIQPLPFASPEHLDPQLQDFLELASRQLCAWLGSASQRSPLPGLGVLPAVEPEAQGLAPELLLSHEPIRSNWDVHLWPALRRWCVP